MKQKVMQFPHDIKISIFLTLKKSPSDVEKTKKQHLEKRDFYGKFSQSFRGNTLLKTTAPAETNQQT